MKKRELLLGIVLVSFLLLSLYFVFGTLESDLGTATVTSDFTPGEGYSITNYTKGGQNATLNLTLTIPALTGDNNITVVSVELPINVLLNDMANASNDSGAVLYGDYSLVSGGWDCDTTNVQDGIYLNWICVNGSNSLLGSNTQFRFAFNFSANSTGTEEPIEWNITLVAINESNTILFHTNLDDRAPIISLDNPVDFYNETATGAVVFNYTANDSNLDACELWGNWTTGWHLNETFLNASFALTSGETNSSSNVTIEDGLYVWSVYCNDSLNNYNNTVENRTLTVDLTAPSITLDSIVIEYIGGDPFGNATFNYTASDVVSDVDTCELWGNWSGGWHLNESFVSPPEGVTNGSSYIMLREDLYVWSVYCNDTLGNYNNTVDNHTLTIDGTTPVVTLDSPSDNSYDADGLDIIINGTAVEDNPDTCTVYFRSNETNWAANASTTYFNNTPISVPTNLSDAVYVWNVECNDTTGYSAFASANRTLTVDTTAPVTPTLTAPTDTSINPRDSISYTCESSDATAGINSWAWTLTKPDSTTVSKTGGAGGSNSQSFSSDDTNLAGTYTVKCEVEDKAGHKSSSSKTFTVFFSHATEAGAGAAADINLATEEEITITKKQGVISTFTLDGLTIHTLKIKKVDEAAGTVTIVIESDPIEITLKIGETKEVDIDGDGANDISITLNKITKGIADITTKRITPLPEKEVPTEEVPPAEKPAEETTPTEEVPSKVWIWILVVLVVIALAVAYFVAKKKKYST